MRAHITACLGTLHGPAIAFGSVAARFYHWMSWADTSNFKISLLGFVLCGHMSEKSRRLSFERLQPSDPNSVVAGMGQR